MLTESVIKELSQKDPSWEGGRFIDYRMTEAQISKVINRALKMLTASSEDITERA